MAFKKFRKMKVYNVSGYNYKDTPTIILKGDWLKETGFEIGSLIQVECENGKLIITPRKPEEVEYHAPCGECMMMAEDCKYYGKDYCIRCHEGRSRQVRLHLQSGIFIEKIRKECFGGGF